MTGRNWQIAEPGAEWCGRRQYLAGDIAVEQRLTRSGPAGPGWYCWVAHLGWPCWPWWRDESRLGALAYLANDLGDALRAATPPEGRSIHYMLAHPSRRPAGLPLRRCWCELRRRMIAGPGRPDQMGKLILAGGQALTRRGARRRLCRRLQSMIAAVDAATRR